MGQGITSTMSYPPTNADSYQARVSPAASTAAASAVGHNGDLVYQILLCLPVLSVLRCKAVCKLWLSLIRDTAFPLAHTRHHPRRAAAGVLIDEGCGNGERAAFFSRSLDGGGTSLPVPPLAFITRHADVHDVILVDHCNGIFLLKVFPKPIKCEDRCVEIGVSSSRSNTIVYKKPSYWVCNPISEQFSCIPNPCYHLISAANIAFDPAEAPIHRIVFINSSMTPQGAIRSSFEVLSSEDGWSKSTRQAVPEPGKLERGFFVNGAMNWINTLSDCIVHFDVKSLLGWTIPLPTIPKTGRRLPRRRVLYFGESGGRIHLIDDSTKDSGKILEINVSRLAEDLSGWSLLYRVDLSRMTARSDHLGLWPVYFISGGGGGGEKEDDTMLLGTPEKLVSYNLRKCSLEELCAVPRRRKVVWEGGYPWWQVRPFSHSFLPM